ncbi:dehydrogenase [Agaricicola taiwanensis]|uniref:Dehydrogenase n=1 Tax=Agaricicola taiwanensis TaxID=591372 RepID=A0A8J2VVC2_9RHOB|nr:2-hydroxyacid dehydrogenase [Agaricicola taiwanensis]GGE36610.1 dehydrogenase [Agaricicola taiwanensis]
MNALTLGIIDPFHSTIMQVIRDALPRGWRMSVTAGPDNEARAEALRNADLAFVMAAKMPADLIASASSLRFIQKLGAGIDNIDTDVCAARGIGVARLQAGNAIPVAEHTLLLMLAACRRLPYLDRETRKGGWDKEAARGVSRQIGGRTVGIIGLGAIGREVAKRLAGFEAQILYYDPYRAPAEVEESLGANYRPLDELLAEADIITLHLPLMKETAGLIDARRIGMMKRDAILINCARGGLVDEAALHQALMEERIFAAGLDAFSSEPPKDSPLLALDQVVVTPHTAGGTLDNFKPIVSRAFTNAQTYLAGGALPPGDLVVDPRRRIA